MSETRFLGPLYAFSQQSCKVGFILNMDTDMNMPRVVEPQEWTIHEMCFMHMLDLWTQPISFSTLGYSTKKKIPF